MAFKLTIEYFYLSVAVKSIVVAVFSSILIFLALAYTKIFHKIRKDQDRILMLLMISSAFWGFLQVVCSLMTIGLASNAGIVCEPVSRLTNIATSFFRASVFGFLGRKASLVQYSANAAKWLFRLFYFVNLTYFLFGLLSSQIDFQYAAMKLPIIPARMCYFTYHSWTTSTTLALDVILNLLSIYLFSSPLRSHLKEIKNASSTGSATNSAALSAVIKRNFKGSITAVVTSFVVMIFVTLFSTNPDYGVVLTILSFYQVDNAVSLCCLVYVCHNAWEFPESWKRFATAEKSNVSTAGRDKTANTSQSGVV